jgi:RNA polymerase sporulation-specific sigma factor
VELKMIIDSLQLIEKQVIVKRFYEDKTQKEVAKELNISQAQVSRIELKALKTLKKAI